MEIRINGHPVEFVMEKEKNLKDVVESILGWARERELIFSEAWVDEECFPLENVPAKKIDEVATINCVIVSKADLVADSICEATDYCGRLIEYIIGAEKGAQVVDDDTRKIVTGLDWLVEVSTKVLSLLGINPLHAKYRDKSAQQLFEGLGRMRKSIEGGIIGGAVELSELRNLIADFRDFLRIVLLSDEMRRAIITSIDSPDTVAGMLEQILDDIPHQKQNLENSAAAYQAGKDSEGSSGVESFIDFIYRYFRVCHQIKPVFNIDPETVSVEGMALNEKNAAINELLNQMILSLENNDIIGLTDVLEYELVPALSDIEAFCKAIFSMLQASK